MTQYPLRGEAPGGREGGGVLRMGLVGHSWDLLGAEGTHTSKGVTGREDQEETWGRAGEERGLSRPGTPAFVSAMPGASLNRYQGWELRYR